MNRLCSILILIITVNSQLISGQTRVQKSNESGVKDDFKEQQYARSASLSYITLLTCVVSFDGNCILDESENILYRQYNSLWGKFYVIKMKNKINTQHILF